MLAASKGGDGVKPVGDAIRRSVLGVGIAYRAKGLLARADDHCEYRCVFWWPRPFGKYLPLRRGQFDGCWFDGCCRSFHISTLLSFKRGGRGLLAGQALGLGRPCSQIRSSSWGEIRGRRRRPYAVGIVRGSFACSSSNFHSFAWRLASCLSAGWIPPSSFPIGQLVNKHQLHA